MQSEQINYTDDNIRTLEGVTHIRMRPGMYIGRLGPMTIVTLWYFSQGERTRYPEGNLSIG